MEKETSNPLRDGLVNRAVAEPCALVIFGATGDLTRRKLIPALYNLAADGNLPAGLAVVCFARRDKTSEGFREELGEAARKYSRRPVNDELWNRFAASIFYHRSSFDDPSGYISLGKELDALDQRSQDQAARDRRERGLKRHEYDLVHRGRFAEGRAEREVRAVEHAIQEQAVETANERVAAGESQ